MPIVLYKNFFLKKC